MYLKIPFYDFINIQSFGGGGLYGENSERKLDHLKDLGKHNQ